MVAQQAGEDKWIAQCKKDEDLLVNHHWKSLEKFVAQHRAAYISMASCAQHITRQIPEEPTRVDYLLDGIVTTDAELQAAMATVRQDTRPVIGARNNFERAA